MKRVDHEVADDAMAARMAVEVRPGRAEAGTLVVVAALGKTHGLVEGIGLVEDHSQAALGNEEVPHMVRRSLVED